MLWCPCPVHYPIAIFIFSSTHIAHLTRKNSPHPTHLRTPPLHPCRQTPPRPPDHPGIPSSSPHPRNAYSDSADPRAGCAPRVENEHDPTTTLARAERWRRKREHSSRYDGRNARRWTSGRGDGISEYERWREGINGEWTGAGEEEEGERRRPKAIDNLGMMSAPPPFPRNFRPEICSLPSIWEISTPLKIPHRTEQITQASINPP